MTSSHADELLRELRAQPVAFEALHERLRAAGSPWSADQLRLFLRCVPGVQRDSAADTFHLAASAGVTLEDAILPAVRSFAGRPVPASEVRARLPAHLVTTDEQIRAVAKRHPELQLVGPGLITIK
mgnify:CR=1 FL=1